MYFESRNFLNLIKLLCLFCVKTTYLAIIHTLFISYFAIKFGIFWDGMACMQPTFLRVMARTDTKPGGNKTQSAIRPIPTEYEEAADASNLAGNGTFETSTSHSAFVYTIT
jgi:hypothetical protein